MGNSQNSNEQLHTSNRLQKQFHFFSVHKHGLNIAKAAHMQGKYVNIVA